MGYEHKLWTVERVSWVIMLLLVLGALAGLFGTGAISTQLLHDSNGKLTVDYDRFARYQTQSVLKFYVSPQAAQNGKIQIALYRDYLDDINIQQVNRQPDSVELDQDKVTYSYQVKQLNQPAMIIFYFNPDRIGPINGKVGLENEPLLSFSQFIYP